MKRVLTVCMLLTLTIVTGLYLRSTGSSVSAAEQIDGELLSGEAYPAEELKQMDSRLIDAPSPYPELPEDLKEQFRKEMPNPEKDAGTRRMRVQRGLLESNEHYRYPHEVEDMTPAPDARLTEPPEVIGLRISFIRSLFGESPTSHRLRLESATLNQLPVRPKVFALVKREHRFTVMFDPDRASLKAPDGSAIRRHRFIEGTNQVVIRLRDEKDKLYRYFWTFILDRPGRGPNGTGNSMPREPGEPPRGPDGLPDYSGWMPPNRLYLLPPEEQKGVQSKLMLGHDSECGCKHERSNDSAD